VSTTSQAVPTASPNPTPDEPRNERGHVPGEPGVWVVIGGDMTVFAILFLTYLYYRGDDPTVFESSQATLDQTFGAVNTLLLLVSSLLVVLAVRAIRAGRNAVAPRLIAGAFACGIGFSILKGIEYADKIDADQTPGTNDFYMYYFVLTGLHWFHVIIGLSVLTVLFVLARRPKLTSGQTAFVEGGASFWHMVDLLWIVIFPFLYLVK
jgi:nitric oxide reductase NorE protein